MNTPKRITALSSSVIAVALFFIVYPVSAAIDTWTGGTDTNWSSAGNWTGGNAPPQAGDSLIFNSTPGSSALNNDLSAGIAIDGITFGGSAFTLNGNGVLLSGAAASNTVGVFNSSGATQTFGTLPLVLDRGCTFSSSGGSLALNGGLTLNAGGIAYFDTHNTSTSLAVDGATGLITGLEGAALMYDGNFTPSSLATINAGSITAYSGYTNLAGASTLAAAPSIGSLTNINLTSTGAAAFYKISSGSAVNTITVAQAGNATGTFLTTLSNTSTTPFVLGQNGGIYVLNSATLSKSVFTLVGGPITAGTSGPATIVFAVNGTTPSNQVSISDAIVDNAGGGHVSVITTGSGSILFGTSMSNSYTGNTYVNQGQLQVGKTNGAGIGGSIYVATNASLYFQNSGIYPNNNLFLSPGYGSSTAAAVANGGALMYSGTPGITNGGVITLMGAPVTSGPGVRITLDASITAVFTNQITGSGTLEFNAVSTFTGFVELRNQTANPNNWQGGLLIDPSSTSATLSVREGANNQIPNGAGAGNVTIIAPAVVSGKTVRFDLNGHNATINALIAPNNGNGINQQAGNFQGAGPSILALGGGNASGGFYGEISDQGGTKTLSLIKIGTGTQVLGGVNTYIGTTTISNGTLALDTGASIANTPVINISAPGTLDTSSAGGMTFSNSQTLNGIGTVNGASIFNGVINPFFGTIGTLTNNGNVTFNGGGTYVWDINNATGTAGADPGWSVLNIQGSLQINSSTGSPFNIDITSLTSGDVPGNAANFNSSVSSNWVIATTTGGISGYTVPGQFNIVTSAFSNSPASSSKWSVIVSNNNLVLSYVSSPAISTPLVDQTNGIGTSATFTVVANGATPPITFNWVQGASYQLNNGGTSVSGSAVTITTNSHTSTLSIAGVGNADAGGITVNVSDTVGDSGSSSATLTIIDPPVAPSVAQSGAQVNTNLGSYSAGGRTYLSASAAGGTQPFTYQWYLGGNAISGATGSNLAINVAAANAGNYTVVIGNLAGSVTSSVVAIAPVTSVPGQIIFEPFDSYVQGPTFVQGSAPDTFSSAQGITNLYNQLTGEPAYWTVDGPAGNTEVLTNGLDNGGENQFGGEYPWPGLAGDSPNEFYWTTTTANNHLRITTNGSSLFAVGGPNTNIYFSFLMSVVSLGSGSFDGTQSVFGGFCTSAGNSACSLEFWTQVLYGSDGGNQMLVGVGKGNGTTTNNPTSGVNINPPNVVWGGMNTSPLGNNTWVQQTILVVGCYNVVDGSGGSNDTVALWINPPASSYYAQTPPTPYLGPTSFGGTVANSVPRDFVLLNDYAPASHRITDLRIGTTWASVTPPSAPTLSVGNVYAPLGTTAVFASQNAGNPVTNYQWQFDGGSPLSDGATGHGSYITGSSTATLTISNVQSADLGTYTVTATNTDLAPSDHGATLTGSASAILSSQPPRLSVVRSAPSNVVVLWPTNWTGFVLEQLPSLSSTNWTTNSLPPYPVSGTNNAVTVPASGTQFFRLINP